MPKNSKNKENKQANPEQKKNIMYLFPAARDTFPHKKDTNAIVNKKEDWAIDKTRVIDALETAYSQKEAEKEEHGQNLFRTANILIQNLSIYGPYRNEFPNYRYDANHDKYHCHVQSGNPTYVMIWEADLKKKEIVLAYLGPHENAPYDKDKVQKVNKKLGT